MPADLLVIGDGPLGLDALVAAARGARPVALAPAARKRMDAAWRAAEALAQRGPLYGRTTGVGANRDVSVVDAGDEYALALLRSHAAGIGEELPADVVRATLLVRLAQMAAGGGGTRPALADALVEALNRGVLPRLRDLGSLGTGDLTVLAQIGLALAGEGQGWTGAAEPPRLEIRAGDALPLISSGACTIALTALAWADAREALAAGLGVAALSFAALDGNAEAYAREVAERRPLPGVLAVAARMRALVAGSGPPARLQDPYGLRALPAVGGALHDALGALADVLGVEANAAAENPLIIAEGPLALHHGGFHLAPTALVLDAMRLALVPFAALSAARLSALMEPALSGLTPFLADATPAASGLMIAEYLATDALARLRADAAPVVHGGAVVSRGFEEHASFGWQGAWQAHRGTGRLRTILAVEWVAAERALRMKQRPPGRPFAGARELAARFGAGLEDRVLGPDVAEAQARLPALAGLVEAAGAG